MTTTRTLAQVWLLAAGILLAGTGCETVEKYSLTYRVWGNSDWSKFSEPAPDPKLAIFEADGQADLLVQYDSFSERHSKIRRQSYYLYQNQPRIAAGEQPKLLKSPVTEGLKPIPVRPAQAATTNFLPGLPPYAVVGQEGRGFTLHQTMEAQTFQLPVYPESSGRVTRIFATPFAVAGDAVMVGGVGAVIGFFCWVQSGAPIR